MKYCLKCTGSRKKKERRNQWVTNLGKEIPKDPRICKEHFEDDQYEI